MDSGVAHSFPMKWPTALIIQSAPAASITKPNTIEPTPILGARSLTCDVGNAPEITADVPMAYVGLRMRDFSLSEHDLTYGESRTCRIDRTGFLPRHYGGPYPASVALTQVKAA